MYVFCIYLCVSGGAQTCDNLTRTGMVICLRRATPEAKREILRSLFTNTSRALSLVHKCFSPSAHLISFHTLVLYYAPQIDYTQLEIALIFPNSGRGLLFSSVVIINIKIYSCVDLGDPSSFIRSASSSCRFILRVSSMIIRAKC